MKDFITSLDRIKILITALLFLLPFLGSQLGSIWTWGSTLLTLEDRLSQTASKADFRSTTLDVLLYIEPQILDDLTALEFTIKEMVLSDDGSKESSEILIQLRTQYRAKVLELERIRERIKVFDPNWTSSQ